jgi:hypothetical protein
MKNTALVLLLVTLVSCSPFKSPDAVERETVLKEIHPVKIERIADEIHETGKKLSVYASPKGPEALQFLSYMIPVLHERGELSIRLWFLENNSDEEIKAFLEGREGAPDASDMLRHANPILCGFEPYAGFLEKLRSFYSELEDPESLSVISSDDVLLDFRLYNGHFLPKEERLVYLVHSPLQTGRHWDLPFEGLLYSMMIHEWPLKEFGAVDIRDSSLGSSSLTGRDAQEGSMASDQIDGLFLMSFPREYVAMQRLDGFVNEQNIAEVLKFFPRQLIREKTRPASYLANAKIESRHNSAVRSLRKMYEAVYREIPGQEAP